MAYHGIETDHIAIRTSSYHAIDQQASIVQVYSLGYLIKNISYEDKLLIVDDVFDTGRSIDRIIEEIHIKARRNAPADIRIAVPYYKPDRNRTGRVPDYYLHETDQWLKFPHSLEGLTEAEVREHRPALFEVLRQAGVRPES